MKTTLAAGMMTGFLMACGSGGGGDAAAPVGTTSATMVPVSVSVSEFAAGGGASLSLVAADSYSGSISGCLSGYSKAITEATGAVSVMDGDKNCVFKLSNLVFGGETFTMSGSESWSNGSSFNITGDGSTLMTFQVVQNLASPISGAQNVSILFAVKQQGTSQSIAADVSTGINIEGADPINLEVATKAAAVDGTDGAGLFSFKLDCASDITGADATAACGGVTIADLKVALALDTYSGDLSVDECRTLATSGGSGTVINLSSDPEVPHGGLATGELKGPATLFAPENANLVMAIADPAAGGGCKFFLITITPP